MPSSSWVNSRNGEAAILYCYALGKVQRVLAELQAIGETEPVWLHGAVDVGVQIYRHHDFPRLEHLAVSRRSVRYGVAYGRFHLVGRR
jgi:hypothetical protein